MGCPTILGLPQGLDAATVVVKLVNSLINNRSASLTNEVVLPLCKRDSISIASAWAHATFQMMYASQRTSIIQMLLRCIALIMFPCFAAICMDGLRQLLFQAKDATGPLSSVNRLMKDRQDSCQLTAA